MASLCTNLFILLYYLALFAVVAEKEEVPVARDIPDPLKSLEKKGYIFEKTSNKWRAFKSDLIGISPSNECRVIYGVRITVY